MKTERGWAGVICCFILFIVVFFSLLLHVKGAFRASGNSELGLLFFIIPGAVSSFISSSRSRVLCPLVGAILAAPLCLLLTRLFLSSDRSFWQELAWLFSAVFWCALGALCYLFVSSLLHDKHREGKRPL